MTVRRLAEKQPESFDFTPENKAWCEAQIAKYPEGRQASAVIPLLWRAQAQHDYWLPKPAIEKVAEMLDMPDIRVLEVATFYSMFNLEPVGEHFIQLCGTTPCMLRGAYDIKAVLEKRIGDQRHVTADGKFSWLEVECLGACCNAPMVQINDDYYEDLTPENFGKLLDDLAAGNPVKKGSQTGKTSSEPEPGKAYTLTDASLFDGSQVGGWKQRFEEDMAAEKAKAEAAEKAKAEAEKLAAEKDAAAGAGASGTSGAAGAGASGAGTAGTSGAAGGGASGAGASGTSSAAGAAASGPGTAGTSGAAGGGASGAGTAGTSGAAGAGAASAGASGTSGAAVAGASGAGAAGTSGTAGPGAAGAGAAGASGAAGGTNKTEAEREALAASEEAEVAALLAKVDPDAAPEVKADAVGQRPAGLSVPRGTAGDDLKRIKGIGPVNETKLNQLGVYHFDQIAGWSRPEVRWVGTYMAFPGRIDREDWQGQARWLMADDASNAAAAQVDSGPVDADAEEADVKAKVAALGKDATPEQKGDAVGTRPSGLEAARGGVADDLKRVKGIGKVNEGKLNGLGIYHFDQIAAWTRPEIRWAGAFLSFAGRIDREDWVGQAKALAAGEDTEFSKRVDAGQVSSSAGGPSRPDKTN